MFFESLVDNLIPLPGGGICLFYGFAENKRSKAAGKSNPPRVKVLFVAGGVMLLLSVCAIIIASYK